MTRAVAKDVQDSDDEQEPIKVSFSLPQIAGGALAAATAAAIGSQLGVAGTIVGAAVASVVGGVAGTLYSAGLDRTHRRVSDAIVRGYDRVRHDPDYDPDVPLVLAADGGQPDTADATAATAGAARPEDPTRVDLARATVVGPPERDRFRVWKVMLLTVGAIFLVGLAVITVLELGLGRALGGGDGTTVSQVVQPSTSSAKPSATPSPTTTSPTPTPTATTTVTVTPSASPSPTASGTATASAPPTGVVEPSPTTPRTPAPTGAAESSGKP